MQVVLDIPVEQKPAWHLHRAVRIPVGSRCITLVDHAELQRAVVQALLGGLARHQVEAPAVQARTHLVLVQVGHHALVALGRTVEVLWLRLLLEVAVEHDFVTLLVGIEEVQHKRRRRLEPADVGTLAAARDDGEARFLFGMELHHVFALFEQLRIPVQGKVIQDGVVLGETHVVRQARAGQRDRHIVHQLVVPIHHTVMHVGCMFRVVEEQHLAGGFIHLHMRRNAVQRRPRRDAELLQRERVQAVAFAALVVRREGLAGMHHHVGTGGVLDRAMRSPAGAF